MSNEKEKSAFIELTGLWLNESKSGEKYFSGIAGKVKYMVFKNKNKKGEKEPDYRLVITQMEPKPEPPAQTAPPPPAPVAPAADDDLPF